MPVGVSPELAVLPAMNAWTGSLASQRMGVSLARVTQMVLSLTCVTKTPVNVCAYPALRDGSVTPAPVVSTMCRLAASSVTVTRTERLTGAALVIKRADGARVKPTWREGLVIRVGEDSLH